MVSLDILLRDAKALVELGDDYDHHTNAMNKGLGLSPKGYPEFGDGARRNIRELSERLEPLLVEAGDTLGTRLIKNTYFWVYKRKSQYAVHAG